MLRYFLTAILLILFSPFIHAQLSIEHGPLWSKASIVNPHHYQSNQHWGSGIQTGFWLGFDYGEPTQLRIGALWGYRRTYFTRYYPEYTIDPLSAEVSRRENFFTLVALLEQRLIRFNPFEWTVSGALGAEFPGSSSWCNLEERCLGVAKEDLYSQQSRVPCSFGQAFFTLPRLG